MYGLLKGVVVDVEEGWRGGMMVMEMEIFEGE